MHGTPGRFPHPRGKETIIKEDKLNVGEVTIQQSDANLETEGEFFLPICVLEGKFDIRINLVDRFPDFGEVVFSVGGYIRFPW